MYHNTWRYIDTISIDNKHYATSKDGGMYPPELQLNDTTPTGDDKATNFIGLNIVNGNGNRFRISVFDKRNSFPFPVRRYPQMSSLLPPTIPYGVFLGQLHRGYRICSHASDFISFTIDVWQRLVSNGCTRSRLMQLFSNFVKRYVHKYSGCSHMYFIRRIQSHI